MEKFGIVYRRTKIKGKYSDSIVGEYCRGDEYRDGWPSVGRGESFQVPWDTGDCRSPAGSFGGE